MPTMIANGTIMEGKFADITISKDKNLLSIIEYVIDYGKSKSWYVGCVPN